MPNDSERSTEPERSDDSVKSPFSMSVTNSPPRSSQNDDEVQVSLLMNDLTPAQRQQRQEEDEDEAKLKHLIVSSESKLSLSQEILTVFLFCFMNFLNYINRYSTPPIVGRLEAAFHVGDTSLGLVQSGFEICYVCTSPIFGFLGDRWQRKYLMAFSLVLSMASGLASSFIPESSFFALLITRSLLGISEASYTNICPSMIGDLFIGKKRTFVLTLYQFAIPLGCGVGYILAGSVADFLDDWRWAFRLTPLPMLFCAFVLVVFIKEPQRGAAELAAGKHRTTSWKKDVAYLVKIPSFLMVSLAFVGVSFATGALCYWTPDLMLRMLAMQGSHAAHSEAEIGLIFGMITIASGVFGVGIGVFISNTFLKRFFGLSADGIVCGVGMIIGAPIVYFALVLLEVNMVASWVLIAVGIATLSCNLVLLNEITLNVVIATRRASAEAFQTTISHLFGDTTAPYFCGLISDYLRLSHNRDVVTTHVAVADYTSLQSSLFTTTFIMAIAGGFFMVGSLYVNEDADKAKNPISPSLKDSRNK